MYAVIFKAKLNKADQEYFDTAKLLRELAQTQYGCKDFISVTEGDLEIAISYWDTKEQIRSWKQDPKHLIAQQNGRDKWYASYEIQIVKVEKNYEFTNHE